MFTAVDDEERKQGVHMDNPRLQQLVRSPEGPYLVGLLDDFLGYYGMAFTRSTLESEASMVSGVSQNQASHPRSPRQAPGRMPHTHGCISPYAPGLSPVPVVALCVVLAVAV